MANGETEGAQALRVLLARVSIALGLDARIEIEEDDERIVGRLEGDDLGLFIGHHGQTIEAVQHLAQRIVGEHEGEPRRRVIVDAAGYRQRREAALQRQAEEAAATAVRTGRPVALDAMTSSERRVVHEFLRDRAGVETHSEGQEPERHLVVSPVSA